jgi:hypothetical protein
MEYGRLLRIIGSNETKTSDDRAPIIAPARTTTAAPSVATRAEPKIR